MKRTNLYFVVLFVVLLVFEVFSYISSKNTLMSITGWEWWAGKIAFAFCAVDLAGLPLIQVKRTNPDFVRVLAWAWILTVFGDTVMTWYSVALQTSTLTTHVLVQSGIVSRTFLTIYFPLGVAIITWCIQTLLVHWMNKEAEKTFSNNDTPSDSVRRLRHAQTGRV